MNVHPGEQIHPAIHFVDCPKGPVEGSVDAVIGVGITGGKGVFDAQPWVRVICKTRPLFGRLDSVIVFYEDSTATWRGRKIEKILS